LSPPLYYRQPIIGLQRLDLVGQRGLGKVHALGGTRHAAGFMQRGKGAEMTQFKHIYEYYSLITYKLSFDS
jgi:hypothetical protein